MSTDLRTDRSRSRLVVRIVSIVVLAGLALFYLQFGLQAVFHHVPQGLLAVLGAVGLGWGAVRKFRHSRAAGVVFWTTLPLLILHAGLTMVEPGELPFLIGSTPVPAFAALVWLVAYARGRGTRGG